MAVPGHCQWPICAVRLCNTCHKFQKEESHQVDKFPFSLFPKYYASKHDTLPTAKRFGSTFVATVSLHEPVKNAEKNGPKKKEIYLRPFWRRNTVVRHVTHKTRHFLSRVEQNTHTQTATLGFPINKVITFRNASHQNDRWFASWNIKKCLSVEIKSFRTRTVGTRNGGELLQYDSGDTTHS
jgi:hypothetical protein